jgi:hypothetical protein
MPSVRSSVLQPLPLIASKDPNPVEDAPGRRAPQCVPRGVESVPGSRSFYPLKAPQVHLSLVANSAQKEMT